MAVGAFRTPGGPVVPAVTTAQMREIDRVAVEELGPNLYQAAGGREVDVRHLTALPAGIILDAVLGYSLGGAPRGAGSLSLAAGRVAAITGAATTPPLIATSARLNVAGYQATANVPRVAPVATRWGCPWPRPTEPPRLATWTIRTGEDAPPAPPCRTAHAFVTTSARSTPVTTTITDHRPPAQDDPALGGDPSSSGRR